MSDALDIRDLIGKPFGPHGRGPETYDCWGVAMEVHRRLGIDLPDFAYGEDMEVTILHRLVSGNRHMLQVLDRPEPFCLVGFSITSGYEHHFGTVLEDCRRFIHVRRRHTVRISRLNDPIWRRRVRGIYRWIG